jgi:hypothetical protein
VDHFHNNSEEFSSALQSVIVREYSETPKYLAIKLLRSLAENIDGAQKFQIYYLVELLDQVLSMRTDFSGYSYISAHQSPILQAP